MERHIHVSEGFAVLELEADVLLTVAPLGVLVGCIGGHSGVLPPLGKCCGHNFWGLALDFFPVFGKEVSLLVLFRKVHL